MQAIQVKVPQNIPFAVIEAALAQLGAQVIERKARTVKVERDFRDMIATRLVKDPHTGHAMRDENRDIIREEFVIDGVSVDKAIRKMNSAREAYNRADGRQAKHFTVSGALSTAEYVKAISRNWNLKTA